MEENKTIIKAIDNITSADIGKEIAIIAKVRKVWPTEIRLQTGAFQCKKCSTIVMEEQTEMEICYPSECYKEQGGCGKERGKTSFKLLPEKSKFINMQRIQIGSEFPSSPHKITGMLRDSLAGKPPSELYDDYIFFGTIQAEKTGKKLQDFNLYLEISSFQLYTEARTEISTAKAIRCIFDFLREHPEGATKKQIMALAGQASIGTAFLEKVLEKLKEEGRIFEKKEGIYVLVEI
ncbi:MAG: hypothetical protein AB1485_00015 [Candidatus Thermoplasmatota archaeon]